MSLKIIHDLSTLNEQELEQYKRDVSQFIGLDPDLNGLDTVWMENEHGPGKSLVLYARRGTAEILREINDINVSTLTHELTPESAVFTATGKNKGGRQEIAIGSKSVKGLAGKAYDNAVMTASTRALRRLTMQFTKLGILDESEIDSVQGSTANPAAGAALVGSPVVFPLPQVVPNNAPGKLVPVSQDPKTQAQVATVVLARDAQAAISNTNLAPPTCSVHKEQMVLGVYDRPGSPPGNGWVCKSCTQERFETQQKALRDEAARQLQEKVAEKAAPKPSEIPVAPPESTISPAPEAATEAAPKRRGRPRKPRNTVTMSDVEPEVVNNTPAPAPTQAEPVAPPQANPAPPISVPVIGPDPVQAAAPAQLPVAPVIDDFPGKPTAEQMSEYRKSISKYTAELPSSENLGSVQKMRAFITRMSGTAPQFMTVDQWQEMLAWFEQFVAKNSVKGLVKYINDSLGVK